MVTLFYLKSDDNYRTIKVEKSKLHDVDVFNTILNGAVVDTYGVYGIRSAIMEISNYNRRKIAFLNAFAIMLVLLIHSYYVEAAAFPISSSIQLITGTYGIAGVAVPLFFFISGLLFFKNIASTKDCISGIRRRVRTLFIPYLIWNVVFVGYYVVLSALPGLSEFSNSEVLKYLSLSHPISTLEYLFWKPVAFHLWFLRDLILFVILTPILWISLKSYPWGTLIALLLFGIISGSGIVYFAFGAFVSLYWGIDVFSKFLSTPRVYISLMIFVISSIMTAIPDCTTIVMNHAFRQFVNFSGIFAVWGIFDILYRNELHEILEKCIIVSNYSFFIYLFHEPVFNIIKKVNLIIFGANECSLVILYFINPILMVLISILVAMSLKRIIPRIYSIAVGGR